MDRQRWPVSCHQVSLPRPDQTSFDRSAANCLRLRWHEQTSTPAKSLSESTRDNPNRWNLLSTPPGDTVIPGVRPEFPSVRSEAETTQSRATFASLDPVDTSLPGECARLVMTGRTHAARTPTLPSYYAATASRVWVSPTMGVLNPQRLPKRASP